MFWGAKTQTLARGIWTQKSSLLVESKVRLVALADRSCLPFHLAFLPHSPVGSLLDWEGCL
jgi:hypothetical protein